MHKTTKDFIFPNTLSQLVLACWVNLECDNLCLVNSELNIWCWVNSDWKQLSGILSVFYQSIEWFIEVQDFLRSYDSAPHPSRPPLSRQLSLFQSSCVSSVELTYGGGGGGGWQAWLIHTIARKPGPQWIINTLCWKNLAAYIRIWQISIPPHQRKKFKW